MSVDADAPEDSSPLPLLSTCQPRNNGWAIRLGVRAEHVEVEKQLVVYEQVTVRRYAVEDTEHLDATVRREELRIEDTHD